MADPIAEGSYEWYRRELERARTDLATVMRTVSGWCVEYNDFGGVDAGDLAWRLEEAGHPLPDAEETTDAQ